MMMLVVMWICLYVAIFLLNTGKIDHKFREAVFKRKGMKKGNLTEALEEAMLMWIAGSDVEESKNEE